MQTMENLGEKQNKKYCCACQMYTVQENKQYCESCEPLMKKFAKEIKKKYDSKNKS